MLVRLPGMSVVFRAADSIVRVVERVQVPKFIIIRNFRLGVLLKSLQVCAVLFFASLLLSKQTLVYEVVPTGRVRSAWVEESRGRATAEHHVRDSIFCSVLEQYDYVYSDAWVYENYSCADASLTDEPFWWDGDQTVFVPMSYSQTLRRFRPPATPGDGQNATSRACPEAPEPCTTGGWALADGACVCETTRMFFITGLGNLDLVLDHAYEVRKPSTHIFSSVHESNQSSSAECCDRQGAAGECTHKWTCEERLTGDPRHHQLKTVVLVEGAGGATRALGSFTSPEEIRVSLDAVVRAADLTWESINLDSRPNLKYCGSPGHRQDCSSSVQPFGVVRQTGLEIIAKMQYNNLKMYPDIPELQVGDHQGPLCTMHLRVLPAWKGRPGRARCEAPHETSGGTNACLSKYYYGIGLSFVVEGAFGYYDPNHFFITLGAGIVYLAVPLAIIAGISQYLLGVTSNIYYAAGKQRVQITSDLAGMMARMLCAIAAYELLAKDKSDGITKQELEERVRVAFSQSEELKDSEQQLLVDHVFAYLDPDDSGRIDLHEFVQVCISNEAVSVQDVAQLYNTDRFKWPLEWVFTPKVQKLKFKNAPVHAASRKAITMRGDAASSTSAAEPD